MTLVLTCLTEDYVIQAVDRRLTKPDGTLSDDDTKKSVFWCGRSAVAYTGPARIEDESTPDWIGKCMTDIPQPRIERVMKYVAERADKYFRQNKDRIKKFAVVAAGWAKVPDEIRPYIYVASNYMTDAWVWNDSASDKMSLAFKVLPKSCTHMVFPVGQPLTPPEEWRLRRGVNRAVIRGEPATVIAKLLGDTIQSIAMGNDPRTKRVGKGMSINLVPRKAAESHIDSDSSDVRIFFGLRPDALSFHYISPDGSSDRFKGAGLSCHGVYISEFYGGSGPPPWLNR